MIVILDEKKIARQLSQIKSTKATKIQELKVLTDAIQKARDTDEDELITTANVANCVIDQAKIEQILLIKEDLEAQQILKNPSTTPNNCLHALTSGLNQYYPSPYRSYA